MITWLADLFKDHGLPTQEVAAWKGRGRPYTFAPIGVMMHHTASSSSGGDVPALNTVTNGRSDLPGPLCHVLVGRHSAGLYVVAAGYANHAGLGGPFKTVPKDSGNRYFVGFEWENNGIDEKWPSDQLEIGRTAMALVLKELDASSDWLIGHREWAPTRKIDPNAKFINMDAERSWVKAFLSEEEDDLSILSEAEQKKLKELLDKDGIYDRRNVLSGFATGMTDQNSGNSRPKDGVYKQLGFDLMDQFSA